jgi:adenylate cyclase
MVTTGEIGVLKKEIIFTGDVLNTAARIQGLCNQFNVDILISGDLA